jgi:prefoldin subunit 5
MTQPSNQLEQLQQQLAHLEAIVSGLNTTLVAYKAFHGLFGHFSESEEATIVGYQNQIDEAQHSIAVKRTAIAALQTVVSMLP